MTSLCDLATLILGALLVALVLRSVLGSSGIKRDGVTLKKPPNTLPLVGNGLLFIQALPKLFSWFAKCERQFGYETFEISVPSLPPGVVINDPRNLEFVFKNEGLFAKGEFVKKPLWDLFGQGIINSDGEQWKIQRKAGLSFLNTKNLQILTDIALPQYLSQSVQFLKSRCDGQILDLQAVFLEITTQLMGKMAYNMEMHAHDDFTVAFDYASGATAERIQNPLWQITEIFLGSRLRKSISVVKAFGKHIVSSAMEDRRSGVKVAAFVDSDNKLDQISGSLIQSLLDSIDDPSVVADAALNYLSAGRDTTAQALTWTFYLLMKHRYVTGKIRKEVQSILKDREAPSGLLPFDPTLFTPWSMPYTMAVFCETLRLYPPIPIEMKQVQKPTTLPDGTFLPQDSVIVWCPWAMNRSKTTWGEDADVFRPERWLVEGNLIWKSASEFPVFNGGPRTCLGKKMAEGIAVQVIATVAWMFDLMPAYEKERTSKSSLTLPMEGGLPCFVKTRSCVIE